MTPLTAAIAVALICAYVAQMILGDASMITFALWPFGHQTVGITSSGIPVSAGFEPWQLITYGFLHGDVMHLLLNLLGLVVFGPGVERLLGRLRYGLLLTAGLISAGIAQLAVSTIGAHEFYPTIGASGAIYAVIVAAAMLFPEREIFLGFPPVFLPARSAGAIMVLAEVAHGVLGTEAGVAHFAHLGGALVGFLLIHYWRKEKRAR